MTRLLRIFFVVYLFVGSGPPGVADTTADLRTVFTLMPSPRYPMEAYERVSHGFQRIEGTTVYRVTLDAKGRVSGVQIIKSSRNKYLDAASTEALRNWRAKSGRPNRFFDIPIRFTTSSNPRHPLVPLSEIGLPGP
jgi:TonB family protein